MFGRILRVNLDEKKVKQEGVAEYHRLQGGRALISGILLEEMNPHAHPLGKGNKLILAPGLLSGTAAPCSGRLSVGGKSPLTGGIKESNVGGMACTKMAHLGIKGVILEGIPDGRGWWIIKIDKDGVDILPADELIDKETYEVADRLQEKYGKRVAVISIGPVGEKLMAVAGISVTNMEGHPSRYAARGGLGAVMGSKRIKAILLDDYGAPALPYANRQKFTEIVKPWAQELVRAKSVLTTYGTANLVNVINNLGGFPTRNFSSGSFEKAESLSGEVLKDITESRGGRTGHPCHQGCIIRCSNIYHDQERKYLTSSLEYETIGLLGANLGIGDLDDVARLDRMCDEFGIDTIEIGNAIGVAMEAGLIQFGDIKGVKDLLKEVRRGTLLGRLLGAGALTTARVLGIARVSSVKGQGMPAYDPRVLKGNGVTYATSPMGADHTCANLIPGRAGFHFDNKNTDMDPTHPNGKIRLSRDLQIMTAVCDSFGFCFFVGATLSNMGIFAELIRTRYGLDFSVVDVLDIGVETIKREIRFNEAAGLSPRINDLPEFFRSEPLPPKGHIFEISKEDLISLFSF